MKITQELLDEAMNMQEDKHKFIEFMVNGKKNISYSAASDVYLYLKITELKKEMKELRGMLTPSSN